MRQKNSLAIKAIAVLMIFTMLFSFTACKQSPKKETQSEKKIITDCIGREVEIKANPKRIAALDSFTGEAMVMIGGGEKMVAAPNGVKMDKLLQKIYPQIDDVGVPMSGGTVNAETLLNLNPDLVFIKNDVYISQGEAEKLDKLGIPYLVVKYYDMEEQMYALNMIGESMDGQEYKKAKDINKYYKNIINKTKKISNKIPKDKKLRVYHSINESIRTDGKYSLGNDWINCVGCINVSTQDDSLVTKGDYFASIEQIFKWDPDIFICNEVVTKQYLKRDKKWAGLRSIYENNVYNIPVGATRWGQRGSVETFFAMLWLGTTVYPEYYKNIDLKSEVVSFYKDYLGIDIDDNTYNLILSGNDIRGKSLNIN